jgi:hypothetical protein
MGAGSEPRAQQRRNPFAERRATMGRGRRPAPNSKEYASDRAATTLTRSINEVCGDWHRTLLAADTLSGHARKIVVR